MTEIVFGLIIIALLAAFVLYVRESNAEKAKLINALIAKNPEQYRDLLLTDKVQIKPTPQRPPDVVPFDEISDEEFEEHIKKQLE